MRVFHPKSDSTGPGHRGQSSDHDSERLCCLSRGCSGRPFLRGRGQKGPHGGTGGPASDEEPRQEPFLAGAGRAETHSPMGASWGRCEETLGWGLCSPGRGGPAGPQAAALASGWAQPQPAAYELGHSTSDAQSHSPAMLEMLTFSLFELQGILRKKKKRAINSCFGNGRGGISLKPKSMVRGAGSAYLDAVHRAPGGGQRLKPLGHRCLLVLPAPCLRSGPSKH